MANDPMQALQDAGIPLTTISDTERTVITQLSPEEVQTLVSIRKKLAGDGDDTAGFVALPQGIGQFGARTGVPGGALTFGPVGGRQGTGGIGSVPGGPSAEGVVGIVLF